MAASSQVSQNKRGRDEYLNSGLASPEANRTKSGTLVHDSDMMTFLLLQKIDDMDTNEETDAVNEVGGEIVLNGVIKSLQDEVGLKAQTDNDFESTDENSSSVQMGTNKQLGDLTAFGNSEAISVMSDIGDFTYNYDDFRSDLDFFVDHITPDDFAIIMQNYLDGDSVPDITYSNAVHGYVESTDVSYGFLWEDDICLSMNEHSLVPNDFQSPQQEEEFGISGAEFHDVWN